MPEELPGKGSMEKEDRGERKKNCCCLLLLLLLRRTAAGLGFIFCGKK